MNLSEFSTNNETISNSTLNETCHSVYRDVGIVGLLAIHRPMVATIDRYVTPLWYAIGFPGNLLAFLVWIQVRMRPSSGCYLAALALNDFLFLTLHVCFELQNTWHIKTLYQPVWCELFPIFYLSAQHLSPLLVLGFTVERYISICHPFKREKYCSTKRAVRVIISLVCFVLLLNAVQGYFWTFVESECSLRKEVTRNDTRSLWSVWSWVTELLIFGVVPIVILVLNVLVIKEAKRMSDREKSMMMMIQTTTTTTTIKTASATITKTTKTTKSSGGGGQSSATTLTLLVVSFYLIFSTLPVTVCYALFFRFPEGDVCASAEQFYTDDKWQRHFSYWNARVFIQEMGMSHYSGNIFIYLLTGLAFRRELKLLFLRLFCNRSIKKWLTNNASEITQLTTFSHKYTASNGQLENVGKGGAGKVMI